MPKNNKKYNIPYNNIQGNYNNTWFDSPERNYFMNNTGYQSEYNSFNNDSSSYNYSYSYETSNQGQTPYRYGKKKSKNKY